MTPSHRARECIYLGRTEEHKAELVRCMKTGKELHAYEVIFFNECFPGRRHRPIRAASTLPQLRMGYVAPAGESRDVSISVRPSANVDEQREKGEPGQELLHQEQQLLGNCKLMFKWTLLKCVFRYHFVSSFDCPLSADCNGHTSLYDNDISPIKHSITLV